MPVISLLADMPRGDPARGPQDFAPPSAAFFDPDALLQGPFVYRPGRGGTGSIFLGLVNGTVREDEHGRSYVAGGQGVGWMDDRHIVTVAGSRAGKALSVLVPNMLHYPGSVLALDPKGELATLTARPRDERLGQKVYVLDPFGTVKGRAVRYAKDCGFNPLMAMRPGRYLEDAGLIADALVPLPEKDPHWDESARVFIEGVILHVATHPAYADRRNLSTVFEFVSLGLKGLPDPMAGLIEEMLANTNAETGDAVAIAAANFQDKPPIERGSVLSTARRHLRFLGLPGIGAVTAAHSFDLAVLKTAPATVYVCLPARHMGTCARWLRLFVNLTLQAMEVTPSPVTGLPVLMILDEFAVLGHLRQVEEAAGQIAGFGVKLWPVLQDLGQLKALYRDRWETFLGNAGVLQFFGNSDLTTLEWISKRCGRATIRVRSDIARTEAQIQAGAKGESWRTEVYDLLSVDEAARKFARDDALLRQLVLIGGRRPIVLQRANYDRHELFKGMAEDHRA